MLYDEVIREIKDPIYADSTLTERIKLGFDLYKYSIREELTNKSLKEPYAEWYYDNHYGFFVNKNDLKIALVLKENDWTKYVVGRVVSNNDYSTIIAALPFQYHSDIVEHIEKELDCRLAFITGGYINTIKKPFYKPSLELYGSSYNYGRANHKEIIKILKEQDFNLGEIKVKLDEE